MLLWGSWEHLRLMAWPQNWNRLDSILLRGIKLGNHYAGNKGQVLLLDWINHKAKWCGSSVSKTRWKWGWVGGASASFCRWRFFCLFFYFFCFTWVVLRLFRKKFLFWPACFRRRYFPEAGTVKDNHVFQEVALLLFGHTNSSLRGCTLLNAHTCFVWTMIVAVH